MLKTTAFYISFLGLLSLIYHLVYWGRFDTDVFQFISLQDFITGIAYPLRIATLWAVSILTVIGLTAPIMRKHHPAKGDILARIQEATGVELENAETLEQDIEAAFQQNPTGFNRAVSEGQKAARQASYVAAIVMGVVATVSLVIYFFYNSTSLNLASWTAFSIASILLGLSHFVHGTFNNVLNLDTDNKQWISVVDEIVVTLLVFLPINAALAGYTEAQQVLTHRTYKYVNAASVPLPSGVQTSGVLVYLGKVSTSYFFVSTDFKQHFVVPVDKAPVLNYRVHTAQ